MKITGMTLTRNEGWVIEPQIRGAMRWVDDLAVLNDSSTDSTSETLSALKAEYGKRLHVYDWDHGEHWAEMDARQHLLEKSRETGATHLAIIDSDEILTANKIPHVRSWFESLEPRQCLDVPMIATWKSLDQYSFHTRGIITLGFADAPDLCWRPRGDEQYHHHARPPHGWKGRFIPCPNPEDGGCFHLQWAAWDRIIWKHRHYMMSERVRWKYNPKELNAKYHWWDIPPHGTLLKPVPPEWWDGHAKDKIQLQHEPWYKEACQAMMDKYGKGRFEGLDLWGWQGEQD